MVRPSPDQDKVVAPAGAGTSGTRKEHQKMAIARLRASLVAECERIAQESYTGTNCSKIYY